ncbi:alpha/beta hydrolase [Bradyrhizobium sp. INPA01-394B]|uniref:Alpha/beta hydrolase n=1 Tax=Bradyrhizobium campsiandrae TaxID=1729892 RepID=A0ABR7U4C5_9BRAD|nr:alpha/beta hydrolase [Bradyrhizobium campsiandrae]MBC9879807.1 alpha/beta hydrolase [Bradyrhizobium campsiandrae]MBC9978860.1 alpha/beta hydrolase [Bradyrhizobium campsiandrae]
MQRRTVLKGFGLTATAAVATTPTFAQSGGSGVSASPYPWPSAQLATAGRLGHCRLGNGPAVCVVLHEWLGDHVNWEPVLPYLDPARTTIVFMDLRGYGWSRGMSGSYSLDEAAADVLRTADELAITRFHLIGHSMSGLVAQKIALQAGDRIRGVTLFSPVPPTGFRADEAALKALNAVIDADEAAGRAITARTSSRYGAGWLRRKLAIAREASTVEAKRGYLTMFTTSAITGETHGLGATMHVVTGALDIPFYRGEPLRNAFALAYPRVTFEVIDDAGHYSMLETPVRVAGIIEKQLAAAG